MRTEARWVAVVLAALLVGCMIERAPDVATPPPAAIPAASATATATAAASSAVPTPLGSSAVSP